MIKKYTHVCGSDRHAKLDLHAVKPIRNACWNKPEGGLWFSINESWENWCASEMPSWAEGPRYQAYLKPDARILIIQDKTGLQGLPVNPIMADHHNWDLDPGSWGNVYLDFEKLAKEYDGIAIMVRSGNRKDLYHLMYGWDCDSLCIFNPESIERFENIEPYSL